MRTIRVSCLVALGTLLLSSHAFGSDVSPRPVDLIDDAETCDGAFVPGATSIYPVQNDEPIQVEAHYLLDDVSLSKGLSVAEFAKKPYARIGIELVPTFEEVHFPADGADASGMPFIDSQRLLQLSKEHVGGIRPHGTDVVYTMTSKEIVGGALGGAVAGQADCVGGVVAASEAFAVGEDGDADSEDWNQYAARISGHEIAHLLGAHHHYANCAEADTEEASTKGTVCTLMFNDVFFISLKFSTLESAAVRGYALKYADDTPVGPPPIVERSLALSLSKTGFEGSADSERRQCFDGTTVMLERLTRGEWVPMIEGAADEAGFFTFPYPEKSGRYRASVGESTMHDSSSWFSCSGTASPEIKARVKRS